MAAASFDIVVNGQTRVMSARTSIAGLIAELALDRRKIAVERNQEIVPRSLYETVLLAAGDHIEIVHFIGGG